MRLLESGISRQKHDIVRVFDRAIDGTIVEVAEIDREKAP